MTVHDQNGQEWTIVLPKTRPTPLPPNHVCCAMCGLVFEKGRSDEEAIAEHDRNFPGASLDTACVVCDDCWQKIDPATHPEEMAAYKATLS